MGKKFGGYLRKLRDDRGMSLREVEKTAQVSNAYLSQVERGKRSVPTLRILSRIAKAYGVEVTELAKKAEDEFDNRVDDTDLLSNPSLEYICRSYQALTEKEKRNVREYIQLILNNKKRRKQN